MMLDKLHIHSVPTCPCACSIIGPNPEVPAPAVQGCINWPVQQQECEVQKSSSSEHWSPAEAMLPLATKCSGQEAGRG